MRLSFYERVVVVKCDDDPSLVGATGHVLGIGDLTQPAGYGVMIEGLDRVVCFDAHELQGTGEIAPRSQFYDDEAPAVRVVVKDGKGYIADEVRDED